jgi:signal-transduction protein with cAMP-binding, CBS, and nucleotidyltransferase domain
MKIRDAMHAPAHTCRATTTLEEAARRMLIDDVGTMVVVDESETPIGILTDRDLGVRGYTRRLTGDAYVGDVMSHAVVTVAADQDVFDAASTMAARGIRRLPVLDDEQVVGVIALDDLTQLLGKEMGELARAVSAQADARHYAGWSSWDAR